MDESLGTFRNESDRGVILMGAALLEEMLADLIASRCTSRKAAHALLGDYKAPIGAFSEKIVLAHAFGLLSDLERSHLDWIRELRNDAAHFEKKQGRGFRVCFDAVSTQEELKAFTIVIDGLRRNESDPALVARHTFVGCVLEMILRLVVGPRCRRMPSRSQTPATLFR